MQRQARLDVLKEAELRALPRADFNRYRLRLREELQRAQKQLAEGKDPDWKSRCRGFVKVLEFALKDCNLVFKEQACVEFQYLCLGARFRMLDEQDEPQSKVWVKLADNRVTEWHSQKISSGSRDQVIVEFPDVGNLVVIYE